MSEHPSNSAVQRAAEAEILQKLSLELGCELSNAKVDVGTSKPLEIDSYCESPRILCEVYAHIGKLIGAQYQKLLTDAIKMLLVERILGTKCKKYLVFADNVASRTFEAGSWCAQAVQTFAVLVKVVRLKPSTQAAVLAAQERQKR